MKALFDVVFNIVFNFQNKLKKVILLIKITILKNDLFLTRLLKKNCKFSDVQLLIIKFENHFL